MNYYTVTFLKICYYGHQWDLIWCNDTYKPILFNVKIKRGFKIYPTSSPYCIFTVAKIQYHRLPGYRLDGKAKENS